jgi:chaperonin GroES
VKVGDKVVFGQYAGSNKVEIDGEELILMAESEIFAVVE